MTTDMKPGDHLHVRRGGYSHHGILHSPGYVIHFTDVRPTKAHARVQLTTLEAFADGGTVEVRRYGQRVSMAEATRRADFLLGHGDYHLLLNNCEHIATWCCTGKWESEQVIQGGGAVATPIVGYAGAGAMSMAVAGLGAVPGWSAPGILSGLSTLGGSAVAGAGLATAIPGVGAAVVLNHTVWRDADHLTAGERDARAAAQLGAALGVPAGVLIGLWTLIQAGQPGLSAVGISTGLKALGKVLGGGMLRGLLALGMIGVVAVIVCGWIAYKLAQHRLATVANSEAALPQG